MELTVVQPSIRPAVVLAAKLDKILEVGYQLCKPSFSLSFRTSADSAQIWLSAKTAVVLAETFHTATALGLLMQQRGSDIAVLGHQDGLQVTDEVTSSMRNLLSLQEDGASDRLWHHIADYNCLVKHHHQGKETSPPEVFQLLQRSSKEWCIPRFDMTAAENDQANQEIASFLAWMSLTPTGTPSQSIEVLRKSYPYLGILSLATLSAPVDHRHLCVCLTKLTGHTMANRPDVGHDLRPTTSRSILRQLQPPTLPPPPPASKSSRPPLPRRRKKKVHLHGSNQEPIRGDRRNYPYQRRSPQENRGTLPPRAMLPSTVPRVAVPAVPASAPAPAYVLPTPPAHQPSVAPQPVNASALHAWLSSFPVPQQ